MPKTMKLIQDALVDGAGQGLRGPALYAFVRSECPAAKSKKIVHAAFMALSDPDLKDRSILDAIYDLALMRRLGDDEPDAGTQVAEPEIEAEPVAAKPKKAKRAAREHASA